jgi:hypothetical protein
MRVLFTGGRDFTNIDMFLDTVTEFEATHGEITEIIHGGAKGADTMAEILYIYFRTSGERPNIKRTRQDARWEELGKRAGNVRNQEMVDMKPDFCIPMPGNKGTADCLKRCRKAKSPVFTTAWELSSEQS